MKRNIAEKVEEFMKKNPRKQLFIEDMNEIWESGSMFNIITNAYYLGYMRGMRAKKGGAA